MSLDNAPTDVAWRIFSITFDIGCRAGHHIEIILRDKLDQVAAAENLLADSRNPLFDRAGCGRINDRRRQILRLDEQGRSRR